MIRRFLKKMFPQNANAPSSKNNISWGPCCFCGQQIAETIIDPCSVAVTTSRDKKWQMWFCHASCFKERIYISGPNEIDLSPAHF